MDRKSVNELDCSKKCKHVTSDCEESGESRDDCKNRYDQCVSKCAFA
jgi:hypothetical protein